ALRAGRAITYSRELEAFRYAMAHSLDRGHLRLSKPAVPLCELVADVDAEWQDTVEGWMGARRFDLIADPRDYATVRDWYDRVKNACPTPDGREIRLFGVSVINMAKIQQQRVNYAQSPLSEKVRTADALARSYIDWLLGSVQCCDSPRQ